ncbi:aspartyl-phosphate phosphatase Spo0E family protein [Paenibacillus sp. oral taxon 786]|uniref:aspartyl-phosphate phosphatase Spo0E family protein n=1 Tax=Paenibacillus sp. oral taxon 786 TaxID=652715 RepID=UPI0018DB31B2|nr:aspartyl-phosphate phosphatase Spo0E family protein [Paenibacillus sp. oral taxon 786]
MAVHGRCWTVTSRKRTDGIDTSTWELFDMELILKIEELRMELNHLARSKRLADREMIMVSQQLDELLNEYHRLMIQKQVK